MKLENLTELLKKIADWTLSPNAIRKAIQALKAMADNTRRLDKSLTDINDTLDISDRQLKKIGQAAIQTAQRLRTSAASVLEAVRSYADTSKTAKELLQLSEPAIMLSNVTGMDTSATSRILKGTMQQFDLAQDQLMHISDVLQAVSMSLPYDFADGIRQLNEGIQLSGAAARSAGLDLEHYTSLLGSLIAGTGLSGEQIGSTLNNMMARTTPFSSPSLASGAVSREELSDAEKALAQIGIEISTANGQFMEFERLLDELYHKLDSMSETEIGRIASTVAGTGTAEEFERIIRAYGDYDRIALKADNAGGTTLRNQADYASTLEGKLKELAAIWESIGSSTVNSQMLHTLADAGISVSGLVQELGVLKTAIGAAGLYSGIKNVGSPKMYGLCKYADSCSCSSGY